MLWHLQRDDALVMPSLVGDAGQVLRVLGWALTRIRNFTLVLQCDSQGSCTVAVCGTEL